jgi:hypothetical protein
MRSGRRSSVSPDRDRGGLLDRRDGEVGTRPLGLEEFECARFGARLDIEQVTAHAFRRSMRVRVWRDHATADHRCSASAGQRAKPLRSRNSSHRHALRARGAAGRCVETEFGFLERTRAEPLLGLARNGQAACSSRRAPPRPPSPSGGMVAVNFRL